MSNMFLALQASLDAELDAKMTIENGKNGSSNQNGINPADESEENGANGVNGAGSVKSVGSASNTMANNTMQAYGIMAQIFLLINQDKANGNTNNQPQITALLGQLQQLQYSIDPTCEQNVQMVLSAFENTSTWSTDETNFLTFWNNTNTPPNGTAPVPGTIYNPVWDAFYFLQTNNITLPSLSPDAGFGFMMLMLSVDGSNSEEGAYENLLNDYLKQSGGVEPIDTAIEQFVFGYALMEWGPNGPAELAALLPKPIADPNGGNTYYTNLYNQLQTDSVNWQTNNPEVPQPTDPNYAQDLQNYVDGVWINLLSGFPVIPPN